MMLAVFFDSHVVVHHEYALHSHTGIPKMLRTMAKPLGEVCSVTRRLLRRVLGLQTSSRVNVFFPAKGRILFEQDSYTVSAALRARRKFPTKPTLLVDKDEYR